jgi:hypothetical protein
VRQDPTPGEHLWMRQRDQILVVAEPVAKVLRELDVRCAVLRAKGSDHYRLAGAGKGLGTAVEAELERRDFTWPGNAARIVAWAEPICIARPPAAQPGAQ